MASEFISFRRAQFQYISAERNSSRLFPPLSRGSHSFEQIRCRCKARSSARCKDTHSTHSTSLNPVLSISTPSIGAKLLKERCTRRTLTLHPPPPPPSSVTSWRVAYPLRRAPPAIPWVQSPRLFVCFSVCVCWWAIARERESHWQIGPVNARLLHGDE